MCSTLNYVTDTVVWLTVNFFTHQGALFYKIIGNFVDAPYQIKQIIEN